MKALKWNTASDVAYVIMSWALWCFSYFIKYLPIKLYTLALERTYVKLFLGLISFAINYIRLLLLKCIWTCMQYCEECSKLTVFPCKELVSQKHAVSFLFFSARGMILNIPIRTPKF